MTAQPDANPVSLPKRATLDASPADVLRRLPALDRVMVVVRQGGATHERIGRVERVAVEGGVLRIEGAAHDSTVDLGGIDAIVLDTTGTMKDKVLPRLDAMRGDAVAFSVIGLEGLEPFAAGLGGLGGSERPAGEKPQQESPVLAEDDPGSVPLKAAAASGAEVVIAITAPGIAQRWRGVIEAVKPAMGFANVMTADFHLHLRGGAVAGWRAALDGDRCTMMAEDADGRPTGLVLEGPRAAFQAP